MKGYKALRDIQRRCGRASLDSKLYVAIKSKVPCWLALKFFIKKDQVN
jgi:hypothetical protein